MKKEKNNNPTQKVIDMVRNKSAKADPLGSYTGKPEEENTVPVQDVDDLWRNWEGNLKK